MPNDERVRHQQPAERVCQEVAPVADDSPVRFPTGAGPRGTMNPTETGVMAMTTPDERTPWKDEGYLSEELARLQGVTHIASLADLAQPDLWESDEEYYAFLAHLYASRRSGLA